LRKDGPHYSSAPSLAQSLPSMGLPRPVISSLPGEKVVTAYNILFKLNHSLVKNQAKDKKL